MPFVLAGAVFCAYVVKGLCGFANTLVFSTVMAFTRDNRSISPLDLVIGLPANCVLVWKNRKLISFRRCLPLSLIMLAGSFAGIMFLKNGTARGLKIIFGAVIILVSAYLWYASKFPGKKMNRGMLALIGVLAGIMSGMFGIGALLAAYITQTSESDGAFKGNISLIFLIDDLFRLVVYPLTGILTFALFKEALLLMPVMCAGLGTGMLIAQHMSGMVLKKLVIAALLFSGAAIIIMSIV